MFLELHVVQSFGPSVINRDDTNTPKSTIFGGVPRARVSSQCLKRLMREHYEAVLGDPARSVTSRVVFERVADTLATLTGRDRAEALTVAAVAFALAAFDVSTDKPGSYLLNAPARFALPDLDAVAAACAEDGQFDRLLGIHAAAVAAVTAEAKSKKVADPFTRIATEKSEFSERARDFALRESNLGVALFGRMITMKKATKSDEDEDAATESTRRTDAACAVAHAVSTHRSAPDFDYFTALDDLAEGTGAAMMGSIPFNSACYYRVVAVDLDELRRRVSRNDDLAFGDALRAFIEATILLAPRAKQATFFANEMPSAVVAVVRDTHPVTLANAFERPVAATTAGGFIEPSVAALAAHWSAMRAAYGDAGIRGTLTFSPLAADALGALAGTVVRPYARFVAAVADLATAGA
jgi:CRISPR system Cascade subunit CasC